MKDYEIINLYWERKETAITASADKYGGYCHSISYNILHNIEDAEECVNDTWLGAWKSMPPHRPERLSSFLGRITRNLSLDRFKKYSAEKRGHGQTALALSELEECIPDKLSVEEIIDEKVLVQVLNNFLYSQTEQKRNIFIRRYWYLYSIKDIAEVYNISESKVASLLFRMRKNLKTQLEKEEIYL
ncbi:MAG: sigma-70 family RNA polymerase sigma factor [Clostridiales bacterium]|nr:sigma-70 family RNA polymerase sigma factor [Clostridiales bacterium]